MEQTLRALFKIDGFTDVHISAGRTCRVRIQGELKTLQAVLTENGLEYDPESYSAEHLKRLFGNRYPNGIENTLKAGDSREDNFSFSVHEGAHAHPVRLRAHVFLSRGNVCAAIRIFPREIPTLKALGLPSTIGDHLNNTAGLILVVGPTGSGKSTTLAACVDQINQTHARHIVTLEDPIELEHHSNIALVTQREVGPGLDSSSFAAGVIAAMREDPDVIMIGEIKDQATMRAALTAAQTGHLVLGTLHTVNAAETIDRIFSFFEHNEFELTKSVLAATLRAVVAQRLISTRIGGRMMVAEILLNTPAIRSGIQQGKINTIKQHMITGSSEGQITFARALTELVRSNKVSRDVALASALDPESLLDALKHFN